MQRIDNLKTYCGATLKTTYGSIPIAYTTQKAGLLEVYVEVANVKGAVQNSVSIGQNNKYLRI